MRIKDMSMDQWAEAMVNLTAPAMRIMEDDEAVSMVEQVREKMAQKKGNSVAQFAALADRVILYLLKTHREDTFAVISALTMLTPEQVKTAKWQELTREVWESIDEDLVTFFVSLWHTDQPEE